LFFEIGREKISGGEGEGEGEVELERWNGVRPEGEIEWAELIGVVEFEDEEDAIDGTSV